MIKYIFILSFLIHVFAFVKVNSQQTNRCGTMETMKQHIVNHPEYLHSREEINQKTQEFILSEQAKSLEQQIVIPVVIHVLYNNDEENISDEVILSQIDVLNADYSYTNSDKGNVPLPFQQYAANCEISFCLAGTDPSGGYTNGIIRTYTNSTEFSNDDGMKSSLSGGDNPWPCDKYLNIWVCDLGTGFLGYTYQPGVSCEIDGVVIDYKHFGINGSFGGNYNLGRTTTHEVGHWLNLGHPWGDQGSNPQCLLDDGVSDTPHSPGPNYNCQNFPNNVSVSCLNSPYGDMFMNFMDYSYDNCLNFFTKGQKERIIAAINVSRQGILNSQGCTVGVDEKTNVPENVNLFPNPSSNSFEIEFKNSLQNTEITINLTNVLGQNVATFYKIAHQNSLLIQTSKFPEGNYFVEIASKEIRIRKKVVIIR